MADPPVYSIGALARILGIPAAQSQLEQLRFIGAQVSAGLSTGDAHRLMREQVVDGAPLGQAEIPDGSGLIILLAERDPYAADFSEYFLRRAGYVVVVVTAVEQVVAPVLAISTLELRDDVLATSSAGLAGHHLPAGRSTRTARTPSR
jgi:hypothetical protein